MRGPRSLTAAAVICLMVAGAVQAGEMTALERGDAAVRRRAEGHRGSRALPGPIGEAVAAYEEALAAQPENLEARVKLLRALYFQGEFTMSQALDQHALFERALNVASEGMAQLAPGFAYANTSEEIHPRLVKQLGDQPEAAGIYFWSAVYWGLWCREAGNFEAARKGVANKIRDYAELVIALDNKYENAGGHRVLGRLHTEAPRIPLITGWIDRDLAISELERALEEAPNDLRAHLFLTEALLKFDTGRRDEAMDRLRWLVRQSPNSELLVEETQVLEEAQQLLAEHPL